MMEQNFTQFAISKGLPSDYDTMFESQYQGSLGLAGHVSQRTLKHSEDRLRQQRTDNTKAHQEYNQAILSGEVIDPSGEVTKDKLLAYNQQAIDKAKQIKREAIESQIRWIESLGTMSHLANGKLKIAYQRTVDAYHQELIILEAL